MSPEDAREAIDGIRGWPPEERNWLRHLVDLSGKQALVVLELVALLDARPVDEPTEQRLAADDLQRAEADRLRFAERAAAGKSLPPPEWFQLGRRLGAVVDDEAA